MWRLESYSQTVACTGGEQVYGKMRSRIKFSIFIPAVIFKLINFLIQELTTIIGLLSLCLMRSWKPPFSCISSLLSIHWRASRNLSNQLPCVPHLYHFFHDYSVVNKHSITFAVFFCVTHLNWKLCIRSWTEAQITSVTAINIPQQITR